MGAFLIIFLAIITLAIIVWASNKTSEQQRQEDREKKQVEAKRLSDCEAVVRYFANNHGYIARSVVSREELEEQIDSGLSADELCDFIAERIGQVEGIELGFQGVGESRFPVILPNEYRDKHIYVIGKSGYGKTNFLRYLILQDMASGCGVGVLAPEYEMLVDEILPFIPEDRIDDVVYFNPADIDYPIVLNPLHLEPDEDIDLHVDETFTVLQRIAGDGGPRMDEILRHSLYALTERPASTLLDLEPLLDRTDSSFRNEIIRSTHDERTKYFFEHTYPQLPKDSHLPILNRIGRIIRAKYVRNCLCPPRQTSLEPQEASRRLLNIRRAMDKGKVLLFNLSDGILGEAASQLIGQLIVSKFQTATMSRADQPKSFRPSFYLYLDEFQNFCGVASKSYEKILSRARKYRLGLILAHQQTGQIPLELLREILGNVSTMVSFQVSQPDAVRLSKEFIAQYDFDIESIEPEELLRLNVGQAYCRIGKNSFPMYVPKVDIMPDQQIAEQVIKRSRENYGISRIMDTQQEKGLKPKAGEDPLADLDPEGVFE